MLPRSPHCPNDAPAEIVAQGLAGTCGKCAWGFYKEESVGHQQGQSTHSLHLVPLIDKGKRMGYKARCGSVQLSRDQNGTIGAIRKIDGEDRFFAGISDNWAFKRYIQIHPIQSEGDPS